MVRNPSSVSLTRWLKMVLFQAPFIFKSQAMRLNIMRISLKVRKLPKNIISKLNCTTLSLLVY